MIKLGMYKGRDVCFDEMGALNKNLLLVGKSGGGKSVEAQKIMLEITRKGGTVVAFDWHQTLAEDEILRAHRAEFCTFSREVDVYTDGISCNLFETLKHPDGVWEHVVDVVGATVDALDRTLKFGYRQKAALRTAISQMVEENGYEENGFAGVDKILKEADTPLTETVREKLYPLVVHNVFCPGDFFIQEGKINVIRLSKFDLGTQEVVTEMLLAYIWRLALVNCFREQGIFLFVDECQNLPSGRKSALAQMLSEGRKFGVNLILATQQLLPTSTSVVQQRLTQCGLILYFRPEPNRIRMLAKMIDPGSEKEWVHVLRSLQRGEFVAVGALTFSGSRIERPLRVSAFEEEGQGRTLPLDERGKTYVTR